MKFDWSRFTEADYKRLFEENDYIGAVHVGDICIELVVDKQRPVCEDEIWHNKDIVEINFYVANEDTGYGYKNDILPYDYADGFDMSMPYDTTYDKFKSRMEKLFDSYINLYDKCYGYSLVEHANKPLEIW